MVVSWLVECLLVFVWWVLMGNEGLFRLICVVIVMSGSVLD